MIPSHPPIVNEVLLSANYLINPCALELFYNSFIHSSNSTGYANDASRIHVYTTHIKTKAKKI